jgi:hypothetical protein
MNKMVKILSVVCILVVFSSFTNAQDLTSDSQKADGYIYRLTKAQLTEKVRLKGYTATIKGKTIYGSFRNVFKRQGEVVTDDATGLMWQRSTSGPFYFSEAQDYIDRLNQDKFAGYSNWRIPAAVELASLTQAKGVRVENLHTLFYLDPNFFDSKGYYCMSRDRVNDPSVSGTAVFSITWSLPGDFGVHYITKKYPVKAVRTINE